MTNTILFMIFLQIALIFLNSVFACAEIAVISMNDNKLAKYASEGDKRAIRLSKLTEQPARFLATIQVAITLSGFLGSAFAAENFSDMLVDAIIKTGVTVSPEILNTLSVILITIILSYFTLVFGELVPKQIAMRKSETMALGMSGLITFISKLFAPIVALLTVSTNGILRLCGIDPNTNDEEVGEEEIRMMVDVGKEKGTIDDEEHDFIQNVFDFDNIAIEDIMTHRTDVEMLDIQDTVEQWEDIIYNTGYTNYPICDDSPDQIVGILNIKKYFRLREKTKEIIMEKAVMPAYFVPETLKADILFRNMKKERVGIAVVLDEYGGMSGIISIKDLIEELVGDIEDDIEEKEPEFIIENIEENVWRISGNTFLEDLTDVFDKNFACEEYDTLNGLIFHTVGSLPEINTEIEFEHLKILVSEINNYQVKTAIVTKLKEEEKKEEEKEE